jgi:predicted nucleotidyltransferase
VTDEVLGVAEFRAALPELISRVADNPGDRVVVGSHRKPRAMLIASQEPEKVSLALLRSKARVITALAKAHNLSTVSVIGSVARGDQRQDSDVDLICDALPGATLYDVMGFELTLEELFGRKVSAILRGALDPVKDSALLEDETPLTA